MERGVSIHIGVNHPASMSGYPLSCSEKAAWKMAELACQAGYQAIHVLRGPEATREAVVALLAEAARVLRHGHTLLVTFSGHGSRVPDLGGDDAGWDETWCLHDAVLLDDELAGAWRLLAPGVRVVVVAEACFSGGGGRDGEIAVAGPPAWPSGPVYRSVEQTAKAGALSVSPPSRDDGIRASVLFLTAASENQKAREWLYTRHLLEVWAGGSFRGSFQELHQSLSDRVGSEKPDQWPQILLLGTATEEFTQEVAFHLDRPVMRGRGGPF